MMHLGDDFSRGYTDDQEAVLDAMGNELTEEQISHINDEATAEEMMATYEHGTLQPEDI